MQDIHLMNIRDMDLNLLTTLNALIDRSEELV